MNHTKFWVVYWADLLDSGNCPHHAVFCSRLLNWIHVFHQDPASPRGTPLPSPRENGLDKARLLKKDPCSPASTASSASSSSLKSKEMAMVGMDKTRPLRFFQNIFEGWGLNACVSNNSLLSVAARQSGNTWTQVKHTHTQRGLHPRSERHSWNPAQSIKTPINGDTTSGQ